MKKLLLLTVFLPSTAFAQGPYVGADLQHTVYSYNKSYDIGGGLSLDGETLLEDNMNGLNLHAGYRFNQYFGVEFGAFKNKSESKSISNGDDIGDGVVASADFTTNVETKGVTLDALGYYPVQKFDLIGTVGVSYTDADLELNVPGVSSDSVSENEFGFRAGAGGQYNINDNWNVRGLARYQTADFDNVADNAWTYTLGVNYAF